MTANQIAYMNALETRRHNVTYETETQRHNIATEGIENRKLEFNIASLAETKRSNLERERQGRVSLAETERSHRAQEAYNYAYLDETREYHQATIAYNYANLAETAQHNRAAEAIGRTQASASLQQAAAATRQAAAAESNARSNAMNAMTSYRSQRSQASVNEANVAYTMAQVPYVSDFAEAAVRNSHVNVANAVNNFINTGIRAVGTVATHGEAGALPQVVNIGTGGWSQAGSMMVGPVTYSQVAN